MAAIELPRLRHGSGPLMARQALALVRGRDVTLAHVVLLLAIVVGGLLRSVKLADVPPGLNQDEAVNGYDAYSLLLTGRDHHGHPFPFAGLESFGDWASPLLTFLTIPAVGLFGLNIEAIRGVSAFIGLLAIPAVYLLGMELFGRKSIALVAAWLIAVSPWHVHLSRWAIPPTLVPTMLSLTMLAFVWSARRQSGRGLVAAALLAGLCIASYPTMKLYVPLFGAAALLIYGSMLLRVKREHLLYACLVLAIVAGPILYLSTADPGGRARWEQVSAFSSGNVGAAMLIRQYLRHFSPKFLFVEGDFDAMHTPPGSGPVVWFLLPLLVAGGIWLALQVVRPTSPAHRRSALLVLAGLAIYPLPGTLTEPDILRGSQLIPLISIVAAVGAVGLFDLLWRAARTPAASPIAAPLLAGLVVTATIVAGFELVTRYAGYFTEYPREVAYHFQYGLDEAIQYATDQSGPYDEVQFGDVNEAYIYVLFYRRWNPSDVHQNLEVTRSPPDFNRIESYKHYRFDVPRENGNEASPIWSIQSPGGETAYVLISAELSDGRRILLIDRP